MASIKRRPLLDRFQEKVEISKDNEWNGTPCWDWTAARNEKGYGYFYLNKKDRKKKLNIPIQVLWGKKGVVGKQFNSIKIWQKYTNKKVYGAEINSDHFIPEESPKQTINHLKKFFLKNVKDNSK